MTDEIARVEFEFEGRTYLLERISQSEATVYNTYGAIKVVKIPFQYRSKPLAEITNTLEFRKEMEIVFGKERTTNKIYQTHEDNGGRRR